MAISEVELILQNSSIDYAHLEEIEIPWEHCEWSKTYKLSLLNGKILYLKRTPRTRDEIAYHQFVYNSASEYVPKLYSIDDVDNSNWSWFLLENAGATYVELSSSQAIEAAFTLGKINYLCSKNVNLPYKIPLLTPKNLLSKLIKTINKAREISKNDKTIEELTYSQHIIRQSDTYFSELSGNLSVFPLSIVHGDFWAGNIAFKNDRIQILDWADALWGVSATSIINFIHSQENLADIQEEIWYAYGKGWGMNISQEYIKHCHTAFLIASLIIDLEIALSLGENLEYLAGFAPTLEQLIAKI